MHSVYILSVLACTVNALHNVTIDDNDPQIIYTPTQSWLTSANSSLDASGTHRLTQDPTATAKFIFTGVAVYFLSPLWPYNVNTQLSLDSGASTLIDLVDHSKPGVLEGPETVQSQVVWHATGLANTQHTLLISVGQNQPYAIVDALIYTALDPSDVSSTSSLPLTSSSASTTSRPSTTSGAANAGSSSSGHVLSIILGTVLGVAALTIILIGLFFCNRRRRRPSSEAWSVTGTSNPATDTPAVSIAPLGPFPSNDRYPDYHQDSWHSHPYANATISPIPGAMAPATAAALSRSYSDSSGEKLWQGTTHQMTERFNNRVPSRYQPASLYTITETSPHPTMTPLANSPASQQTELTGNQMGESVGRRPLPTIPPDMTQGYSMAAQPMSMEAGWNAHPYSRCLPAYSD